MDQLRALRYFSKVVETGSFTKAAATFSVPASSLSRRIADLERSLGANLLKRTTRVVQVTEIGQLYYTQVQDVLAHLERSDESVRSYQASPKGFLRISTMVTFGERILIPLLDESKQCALWTTNSSQSPLQVILHQTEHPNTRQICGITKAFFFAPQTAPTPGCVRKKASG